MVAYNSLIIWCMGEWVLEWEAEIGHLKSNKIVDDVSSTFMQGWMSFGVREAN